jgi:hypothetical protein
MSTYKRVNGDYTIQTLGANTITFAGNVANAVTVVVDGNFTVTGNATLTGNISGDKLFNGTTSIEIPAANGNANITIGGVSNVAVFTTAGLNVSGVTSVSGNIVGGNINTAGLVSATGNVNGGNINTFGNVVITRDASVAQPTIRFQDTDTTGTAGTILGAVEWFTSDVTAPGVSASMRATLVDTGGNSNVQILTGTPGSLAARVTVLHTGEVGIANAAPNTTFGVTGTAYISGNTTVAANIAGGNIITAGLVTATGNVTGGNINTAGLATVTGNVTGGNLITAGSITAGAAGILTTGNVRGGNLISDAVITATGNIASGASISAQDQITTQGNVIANNISAGNVINTGILNATSNVSAAGNVTGSNLVTGGSITAVGNVNAGAVFSSGIIASSANVVALTGGFFVGDGGFLSNVTAISNVTTSQITNGTTVMAITGPNGNIFATVNAVGNILVISPTGISVTGTASATGNVTGSNVNTGGLVSATGNINGGNVNAGIGNFTTVIGAANATSLTSGIVHADRLSGSYVINVTGNVSGTAATVTNGAQANITSVGTLTSLAVTGNVTGGNLVTGGVVSATGAVTGAAITGTSLTVSTGNITGGNLILSGAILDSAQLDIQTTALNANIVLTPNGTGNVNIGRMSASGNITSAAFYGPLVGAVSSATTISATGNITGGNINTAGLVSATGAVNAGSVTAGTTISATGNITGGNINTAGLISVTGAVNAGSVTAGTTISATGNITGGNLSGTSIVGTLTTAAQTNITSVGTLGSLSVTGNITGGNLITAGLASLSSIVKTGSNAVGNIGSASNYFNQVFATATTALYADLAEKYTADQFYLPGTVVSFGGIAEVTASTTANDRRIAGVVSAKPSYLMNAGLEAEHTAVVALQGRVPCLVQGPVTKGDMMVSAGNGRAQACDNPLTGAVIGKALENFDGDQGTIEVVVGRI